MSQWLASKYKRRNTDSIGTNSTSDSANEKFKPFGPSTSDRCLDYIYNWFIWKIKITASETVVPMESVSLRLYTDAYPCHRVPTHGLISVI